MSKYLIFGLFNLGSTLLSTVATGRTFYPFNSDYYTSICGKANVGATEAFALLTCIFTAVATIFGFAVYNSAVLSLLPSMKIVGAALAAILVIFSVIPWAVVADHWNGTDVVTRCGFPNSVAFLAQFITVSGFSFICFVLQFTLPDPTVADTVSLIPQASKAKYITFGVLHFVSALVATVATGRTFYPFNSDYYNTICGKGNVGASQAFALLTCIFAGVAMFFGFVVGSSAVLGLLPPMKLVAAAFAGLLVVFSIIPWAIVADHWDNTIPRCGFPESKAFLSQFVLVTVLEIIAFILVFVLPDAVALSPSAGSDDKKDEEAPKEVKSGDNAPDAEDKKAKAAAPAPAAAVAPAPEPKKEEEAPKKQKPQINWKEINSKLPYDKTKPEQKKRRFAMFDQIDEDKDGKVNLAEVQKGMTTVLGLGPEIDVPVVIKTAFDRAAAAGQQAGVNADVGEPALEKNEFRLFLMYTRMYFEMYHLFSDLDESGDMAIDLKEFDQALPLLKSWGAKIEDPAVTFKEMDKNKNGAVAFREFVDWALSPEQNLDCPEDDE